MDDSQTAFANQYQQYGLDIDMMKVRTLFQRSLSRSIFSPPPCNSPTRATPHHDLASQAHMEILLYLPCSQTLYLGHFCNKIGHSLPSPLIRGVLETAANLTLPFPLPLPLICHHLFSPSQSPITHPPPNRGQWNPSVALTQRKLAGLQLRSLVQTGQTASPTRTATPSVTRLLITVMVLKPASLKPVSIAPHHRVSLLQTLSTPPLR